MGTEKSIGGNLSCPHCGALTTSRALICDSCGVNLAEFRALLPRIQELKNNWADTGREELAYEAMVAAAAEADRARQRLKIQLHVALRVVVVLAVLVIIATALYARRQQLHRQWLASQYERAVACLDGEDYLCARTEFETLIRKDANYRDAQVYLNEARYGLAGQYARSGQWEAAVNELDTLLKDNPDDERALSLLRETYDRWITDAIGRKDLLTALSVQLQRSARFEGN